MIKKYIDQTHSKLLFGATKI